MTGAIGRKENEIRDTETGKGRPCEDRGKEWNDVSTGRRVAGVAGSHQ